jgi:hypothetical protein
MEPLEEMELWQEVEQHWRVVQKHLQSQIDQCRDKCLGSDIKTMEEVAELRGRVRAYKVLATLPQDRIKELEAQLGKDDKRARRT